ncbi:PREDICTED: telomerase reverse transcriptase-like [Dinoponera quadriceps]|uniref:Telomerase reverse transcriptase n=1 Tax=Dinoponera quadriceps TaxID=609295 RepID=A0A6P3Y6L7_DINQU|nr:PREDICTED: telomerase reverse transcriptase-like [Dinoponera quadriceps]
MTAINRLDLQLSNTISNANHRNLLMNMQRTCQRKRPFQWRDQNQRNTKRRKNELAPQFSHQYLAFIPINKYNSEVKLFESRSQLRKTACTRAKISKFHILETENTSQDIFHKIISMKVGLQENDEHIDFSNISPTLSPILEKFKKQHKKFKYLDELKNIMKKAEKKLAKQRYKGQIHVYLLKSFFGYILYKNVPLELFGTRQNFKAVKKTVHHLLKTHPIKEKIKRKNEHLNKGRDIITAVGSLSIEPLLKKLDVSKIEWLYPLKNIKEKWIIILKLLHWFFAQYIIKILHKYTVLIGIRQQWVYITKDDWCQIQDAFINEKVKAGDLILVKQTFVYDKQATQNTLDCIKKYRLVPNSLGLRVIAMCKDEKNSLIIGIIMTFLQQLYCKYFIYEEEIPTVQRCIQQILNFKKLNKTNLYYVHCDIQDAFGSIIQEKLLNIIKTCVKQHLPLYLSMCKCRKEKKYVIENIGLFQEMLPLKNIRIIDKKPTMVGCNKLIPKISKLLLKQKIKLYGKEYLIKTGVPQGLRLSPIFSDIYYQDMCNKLFPKFKSSGLLCRYVDDILFITKEKIYAEEFLKLVRKGIPEYNVKFKLNQIKTNVELPVYKPTKVKYIGKLIYI